MSRDVTMNRIEKPMPGREAKVKFLDSDFQVVSPGQYVPCAITGLPIALEDLKYWNVERQEAYIDVTASVKGHVGTAADGA